MNIQLVPEAGGSGTVTDFQPEEGSAGARQCLMNGIGRIMRTESVPQGLKPSPLCSIFGTAEAVPCYKAEAS
jgi:hypothetical protein